MNKKFFEVREVCPACEEESSKELYRARFSDPPISTYLNNFYNPQGGVEFTYLEGESYILNECTSCNLIYQKVIPNDFLMAKLYEEWINPNVVLSNRIKNLGIDYYSILSREIEMIIRFFNVPTRELVFFDFGSGWGDWCRLAKGYGCNAYGTEVSQSRIDYLKKINVPVISWDEIQEYKFDFINTEQVFEHIANPLDTLQHLIQSLKPNGLIKISVPNGGEIKRLLSQMDWSAPKSSKDSLNPVAPLEHINCFSNYSIIKMAGKLNLKLVDIEKKHSRKFLENITKDLIRPIYYLIRYGKTKPSKSTYLFFRKNSPTS